MKPGLISLAAMLLLVAASAPRERAARSTAPARQQPLVTVTGKDGKIVRGTIESARPHVLVLKSSPRGEQVEMPWSDIARVSNGLTREKAIEQYKKVHPDQLCKDCDGHGTAICSSCHGSGFDQSRLTTCTECGGGGAVSECTNPKCADGKVECPRPCLKLTQGVWKTRDGKRWRDFRGRDGSGFSISEGHLGELVEMENGQPVNKGKCPTCGGTTRVNCETCGGASLITCPKCDFVGKVGPPCPQCKLGQVECKTCGGTGVRKA